MCWSDNDASVLEKINADAPDKLIIRVYQCHLRSILADSSSILLIANYLATKI